MTQAWLGRKAIGYVLIVGFLLAGCAWQDDVSFARRLMDQLIDGKYSARTMIDWTKLKFLGKEVGDAYAKCEGDACKITFERAFIENFSKGYKQAGAKKTAFFNWKIYKKDPSGATQVSVNVYDENTFFVLTIAHVGGEKKLVEVIGLSKSGVRDVEPVLR
jgi:hypothetical protein